MDINKPTIIKNATLYNCDCMELMKQYPDNHFDLAIVDPPYGIGVAKMNIGARKLKNETCDDKNWDDFIPDEIYFKELERVSKEQIVWGANYFNCFNGKNGAIVWDKDNPLPTSSRCEIASYSKHQKVAYYHQTWTNYVNDRKTKHPTEKPVKLYEWLLTNYAKQGDKILDTFFGSGSIAVACNNLGFELTACELDEDYFKASVERIKREAQQERLF